MNLKMNLSFELFTEIIKYIDKDQLGTIRLVCKETKKYIDSTLECGIIVHGLRRYNASEMVIKKSSDTRVITKLQDVSSNEPKNPFIICDSKSSISVYFSNQTLYPIFKQLLLFCEILKVQKINYKYISWSSEAYKDYYYL